MKTAPLWSHIENNVLGISVFFSPVNIRKMPVNIFENLPVNIFFCPWTVQKKLAREPKKVPVNTKKVSVNLKSAREHFHKICRSWAFTGTFYVFTGTFFYLYRKTARELQKVPVNNSKFYARELRKSARENVQKSARERNQLPVNLRNKVPVNAKLCPWRSSKNRGSRALLRFTGKTKNTEEPYFDIQILG